MFAVARFVQARRGETLDDELIDLTDRDAAERTVEA